ncbi:hypothetical protein RD110_08925 [Rhodoferax koreense]|uniref:Uncharacterized protein n=2 Tax=Rhodoferax koreensis TaxID=1842727 RepID=A0A1P8JU51_9BURK|nr:hypothetical protein RD110_08925 [Rhodoferax koreense]
MYLDGMAFPVASDEAMEEDGERSALVAMVQDTRWDGFGVFASVIEEVRCDFELAAPLQNQAPAPRRIQRRRLQPALR